MSFLSRIAQQARSPVMPGHTVARPKGLLPSLPAMAAPVDRSARTEPASSRTEPSAAVPEAASPTVVGPSDQTPPALSMLEPDTPERPDQSALDQRLAAVAGTAGTRPQTVEATDLDRPDPPPAADAVTADRGALSGRDQNSVVRVEVKDVGTVAPSSDAQQDGGERTAALASAQEPIASPPEASPDRESQVQRAEPVPGQASFGPPVPAATEQAGERAKSPSDQAVAGTDTDQGEPQVPAAPARQADDTTNTSRRPPSPVFEPVPTPQPERYRPTPTLQPPAPEQPPLLQIDQIDVVVADPAPAQPAAPARARLAAISASRRYLRRL